MPEGKKFDDGKLRFDLIPPIAMAALADVFTRGGVKYGDRNWEEGISYGRIIGACKRHLSDFEAGESKDVDQGQHHLASVMWCAAVLLAYEFHGFGPEFDDRSELINGTTRNYKEWLQSLEDNNGE
jgi:hypothetical protein